MSQLRIPGVLIPLGGGPVAERLKIRDLHKTKFDPFNGL